MALPTLGNREPKLGARINAALNVLHIAVEIVEAIFQFSVYARFLAVLNSTSAAKVVFIERKTTNA